MQKGHYPQKLKSRLRSRMWLSQKSSLGKTISATNGILYDPFFIVGAGRSGTTLLRRILCSSPEVHIPPELYIQDFVQLYKRYKKMRWGDFICLILSSIEYGNRPRPYSSGPLANELKRIPKKERSVARIIAAIAEYDAKQKDISFTRWGDKTPRNCKVMDDILYMFPDVRFIHSYRDGCDVIQSHVQAGWSTYEEAAYKWVDSLNAIDSFKHSDIVYNLRYEELVLSPQKYGQEVCDFLDIPFSTAMLDVNEKARSALIEESTRSHHVNLSKPVFTSSVGKGRAKIPESQRKLLAPIMDEWLIKLGYAPCQSLNT